MTKSPVHEKPLLTTPLVEVSEESGYVMSYVPAPHTKGMVIETAWLGAVSTREPTKAAMTPNMSRVRPCNPDILDDGNCIFSPSP
ncbi:unannotated protein [freshwater metagenome]|uniref:Unannotated protein n=1 Tax=freshwater metagenome TaxID=449393 RepID=A0A6J7XVE5_9ZZZZ